MSSTTHLPKESAMSINTAPRYVGPAGDRLVLRRTGHPGWKYEVYSGPIVKGLAVGELIGTVTWNDACKAYEGTLYSGTEAVVMLATLDGTARGLREHLRLLQDAQQAPARQKAAAKAKRSEAAKKAAATRAAKKQAALVRALDADAEARA